MSTDCYKVDGVPLLSFRLDFYTNEYFLTYTNHVMLHAPNVTNNALNNIYFHALPFPVKVYAYTIATGRENATADDGMTGSVKCFKVTNTNTFQPQSSTGSTVSFTMTDGYGYRGYYLFPSQPTFAAGDSIGVSLNTDQDTSNYISVWLWCYQYV